MISHTHKFIFVHINKNGGTSIRNNLSKYCSHQKYKHEMLFKKIPNNNVNNSNENLFEKCRFPFDYYFKFTFVRNPWDRVLSNYFFAKQVWNLDCSFEYYVKDYLNIYKNKFINLNQLDWISDFKHNVRLDFIGRFENLQNDYDFVCNKIKIPQHKLLHKNKSVHNHYTEYYNKETKQIVAKKYAKDIEYFEYKFGE